MNMRRLILTVWPLSFALYTLGVIVAIFLGEEGRAAIWREMVILRDIFLISFAFLVFQMTRFARLITKIGGDGMYKDRTRSGYFDMNIPFKLLARVAKDPEATRTRARKLIKAGIGDKKRLESLQKLLDAGYLERVEMLMPVILSLKELEREERELQRMENKMRKSEEKKTLARQRAEAEELRRPAQVLTPVIKPCDEIARLSRILEQSELLPGTKDRLAGRIAILTEVPVGTRQFRKEAYAIEKAMRETSSALR